MRTEEDLRGLFHGIADNISVQDLPELPNLNSPRPTSPATSTKGAGTRTAVLAAAALVAVTVTGYAVVSHHAETGVAGVPSAPIWDSTLNVPPGWQLETRQLLRGGTETIVLTSATDHHRCMAAAGSGQNSPRHLDRIRSAQVSGQAATIGRTGTDEGPESPPAWRVQWNPSDGRWAEVSCEGDGTSADAGLELAGQLRFGPSGAVIPVSLASLPGDLAANEVTIQGNIYPPSKARRVIIPLISGLGPTPQPSLDPDQAQRIGAKTVLAVVETLADYTAVDPLTSSRRLPDIDGRPTWLRTTHEGPGKTATVSDLAVVDNNYVLYLNSSDYTSDELVAIAKSMRPAHHLDQESTWYPIRSALGER